MFNRIKAAAITATKRVKLEAKIIKGQAAIFTKCVKAYREESVLAAVAEEVAHNAKEVAVTAAVAFTAFHMLGLTFTLYGTAAVINLPLALFAGVIIQAIKVLGRT